ncbi:sugar ABC transporter substrate-binding protein [Streptomyces sp. NPDC006460]|uniref:ABC transporter substrate-binding protein n=1 Tax=Streptomyces sp. NPDC006460 TaxID=3154304 RepID=UPI0033B77660
MALTAVAGCAPKSGSATSKNEVSYWLWDSNQLPIYEKCAADFEREHPGVDVRISQMGWEFYWSKLTASFIAGTQPDVFTNTPSKQGQFLSLDLLEPLDEFEETSGIKNSDYQPGLAANWIGEDGHRYAAPKDWDTVALFYDKEMAKQAGLSAEELNTLTWNPRDGGTFEKAIARLTVDRNGVRGDEPGFDKDNVRTYGLATADAGGMDGHIQWSPFALANGWYYMDETGQKVRYNYDDRRFQETIDWYFGLAEKGYLPPFEHFSPTHGPEVQLGAGTAATALNGAWMIRSFHSLKGKDIGSAPTPVGPGGKRATIMNGLGDSLTKTGGKKKAARQWVAHLASDACQRVAGQAGIIFPATAEGTSRAVSTYEKQGIDVNAFTKPLQERSTFGYPVTDFGADISALMFPAMQDIYANGKPVSSLDRTNDQINLLFEQGG